MSKVKTPSIKALPVGRFNIKQWEMKDGKKVFTNEITIKNLIVDVGKTEQSKIIGGTNSTYVKYLELGDDNSSPPASGDASLNNGVHRADMGSPSYPSVGKVEWSFTVAGDDFVSTTICYDAGLFFSDGTITLDSGTLLNRIWLVDGSSGIVFQPSGSGTEIGADFLFSIQY